MLTEPLDPGCINGLRAHKRPYVDFEAAELGCCCLDMMAKNPVRSHLQSYRAACGAYHIGHCLPVPNLRVCGPVNHHAITRKAPQAVT